MNDEMIAGNQAHFLLYIGQHPASALELYLCKDWRLEGESRHQPDWGGVASAGHRMVGPGACWGAMLTADSHSEGPEKLRHSPRISIGYI